MPRLRHQVARMLRARDHDVLFFEKPAFLEKRQESVTEEGIHCFRTRQLIQHQLRARPWLQRLNAEYVKREIRRVVQVRDSDVLVSFKYDYYFLRDLGERCRIISIFNDDHIDGAKPWMKTQARRQIAASCRMSDFNLTVSTSILRILRRYSDKSELFLPWARRRYSRPPSSAKREAFLYWGYLNERIDWLRAHEVLELGIPIHLVGTISNHTPELNDVLEHPLAVYHGDAPLDSIPEILDRCVASILPYARGARYVDAITLSNRGFDLLRRGMRLVYSDLPNLLEAPAAVLQSCADAEQFAAAFEDARSNFETTQDAIEDFLLDHYEDRRYEQFMGYVEG